MNALLSLGGWSVIPDFATRHTLQFVYSTPLIHRTLRLNPPAPNTPAYRRHYGITFAVVVLGYLLYTLVEKAVNAPENFYETLGVGPGVDEGGLKLAFRQFAKRYHPDRVGKGGEEKFMEVRKLVEALKNPTVRFAYDRFGPDVLKWKGQCTTTGEYLWHGLIQSSGYHIASLAFLLFWSVIGRSTPFTFWRYILYFALLTLELRLILSPSPSPSGRHITLLHRLFPNRVVYQHILFLHQVFMFLNVALMRVTPHLIERDDLDDPRMEAALVERTMALVNLADRETSKMVHTELQSISHPAGEAPLTHPGVGFASTPHHPSFARPEPVSPDTATTLLNELALEVEALIIENNLKQNAGPLKTVWEAAVKRMWGRRVDEAEEREREAREKEYGQQEQAQAQQGKEEYERAKEVDRERTPTPTSPVPLPALNPLTPAPSLSNVVNGVAIKQEEVDLPPFLPLPKSPSPGLILPSTPTHPPKTPPNPQHLHHSRSPFRSSRFNSTTTPFSTPLPAYSPTTTISSPGVTVTPRSKLKSVPRTPGELPSPRPSPSPPPSPFPRRGTGGGGVVGGYFAKGTAYEEEEMEGSVERIRARSLSC